jgi:2-hydroxycyclohexanecarboxyl-CoA dehydrogenase
MTFSGRIGSKGDALYAACEGGVITFAKSIARENARYGITVNAIAPGPIDTPLLRAMSGRMIDVVTAATRLRRLGHPEEVAASVAFLASEEASYITGETLGVSGGIGMAG